MNRGLHLECVCVCMVGMQSDIQLEIQADFVGQGFVLLVIAVGATEDYRGAGVNCVLERETWG